MTHREPGRKAFLPVDGWTPHFDYGEAHRATWPPQGHPLYSLFHEARLERPWQRTRYETIVRYFCTPRTPDGERMLLVPTEAGRAVAGEGRT